jgi:transcriptional regulator of met regulon
MCIVTSDLKVLRVQTIRDWKVQIRTAKKSKEHCQDCLTAIATIDQTTHLFSLRQTRYDEFCEQVEQYMRGIGKRREFLDYLFEQCN